MGDPNPQFLRTITVISATILSVFSATRVFPLDRVEAESSDATGGVRIRDVRVLIVSDARQIRIRSEKGLTIIDEVAGRTESTIGDALVVRAAPSGMIFVDDQPWSGTGIFLNPSGDWKILVDAIGRGERQLDSEYPGSLYVFNRDGLLSVINRVEIEQYVGCVVANEVWPDFSDEALKTQAIVARTYVLYHMLRRPDAMYDVAATQGSQVYRGIRNDTVGVRAQQAAEFTRGLVCTYRENGNDQLFCTYYSSACGGMSQSAAKLGAEGDIEPLSGGVKCDYCRIAPGNVYRWGPVRVSTSDVLAKLTSRYPEFADLGSILSILPIDKTPSGRPVTLRIDGSNGTSHGLLAERFRIAVGANTVRSTDCTIRVSGDEVFFENGKGFGHGLGLCQWGMQNLTLQGRSAAQVLRFYYPGSRLTRVY